MQNVVGVLLMSGLLLFEASQAFPQSIPPSKVDPISPAVTQYLHIFSCYDGYTGNMLDCQVFDQLNPPANDPASSGGHTHGGTFPLTDFSQGVANGFVCGFCTDFNLDPFVIQTRTDSAAAVIIHKIPQFAGRLPVNGFVVPPSGWF